MTAVLLLAGAWPSLAPAPYLLLAFDFLSFFAQKTSCPGAASPWKRGFFRHSMKNAGTERLVQEY